jgi:hypothetical protein
MAMQQDMEHTWDSKVAINRILIIRLYGLFSVKLANAW